MPFALFRCWSITIMLPALASVAYASEAAPAPAPAPDIVDEAAGEGFELVPAGTIIANPSMGPAGQRTRFNGYLRAGAGVNGDGGTMERFHDTRIGRLGNESDLYGEAAVSHDLAYEGAGRWYVTLRLALMGTNYSASDTTRDNTLSIGLPEAFVGAEKLYDHDETIWVGRRFYHRREVHITDFYYQDLSGNGFGVDRWDFGDCSGSAAVIINGGNMPAYGNGNPAGNYSTAESVNGRPALTALTASVDLMPMDIGALSIEGVFGGSPSGSFQPAGGGVVENYDSLLMGGLGAYLTTSRAGRGRNTLAMQGGLGSSTPFNLTSVPTTELMAVDGTASENVRTPYLLRVVEDAAIQDATATLGAAGTLVGEWSDSGSVSTSDVRRIDAVVRGAWWWNRHFGMALEPGSSWIDAPGSPANIAKFTTALQMRVADTIMTRPVFRLFATYAYWSDEAPAVGPTHADESNGWNFGAQAEAWW